MMHPHMFSGPSSPLWLDPAVRDFLTPLSPAKPDRRNRIKNNSPEKMKRFYTKKTMRAGPCIQIGLLSGLAMMNSGRDYCSLREIYAFIVTHFEGFDIKVEAWKKSIRHSLCTHTHVYTKMAGEGLYGFSDKMAFIERLNSYTNRNSNVATYGLKHPEEWPSIRQGVMGVPAVLDRNQQKEQTRKRRAEGDEPEAAMKKKRTKTMKLETQVYGYGGEVMPQFHFDYPVMDGAPGVWNQVPAGTDGDLYLKEYTNYIGYTYPFHSMPLPYQLPFQLPVMNPEYCVNALNVEQLTNKDYINQLNPNQEFAGLNAEAGPSPVKEEQITPEDQVVPSPNLFEYCDLFQAQQAVANTYCQEFAVPESEYGHWQQAYPDNTPFIS